MSQPHDFVQPAKAEQNKSPKKAIERVSFDKSLDPLMVSSDDGQISYEQARALAAASGEIRCKLATRPDVPQEILYYLAGDGDVHVRRAVAANPSAPARANLLLSNDDDEDVRTILAGKVAEDERINDRSAPKGRARSITLEVLDRLSLDRVSLVRAAIAEGLKQLPNADPGLILRLARDLEIIVAAPILEYSPLLGEEDLLDIIRSSPIEGALAAISRRAYVDPAVTDAIVASGERQAITHLLYNSNAQLQEHTLDALIARAEDRPEWHQPLVHRPELADYGVRRLAEILADHLLQRLIERSDLSQETAREISEVVNSRLRAKLQDGGRGLPDVFGPDTEKRFEPLVARARSLFDAGALDETAFMVSLLTDHADDLVAGLAVRAGQPVRVVLEIISSQSARAVCALAWAAGLSARFSHELQLKLGRVPSSATLPPRNDGSYPLPEVELRWQLEMYSDH
jgi:uncharacterized protein (DUF2336 family)